MSQRKKPQHADFYDWDAFVNYANNNGISNDKDDWLVWWECWVAAYKAAMR